MKMILVGIPKMKAYKLCCYCTILRSRFYSYTLENAIFHSFKIQFESVACLPFGASPACGLDFSGFFPPFMRD